LVVRPGLVCHPRSVWAVKARVTSPRCRRARD
jgi:hypothetical protein